MKNDYCCRQISLFRYRFSAMASDYYVTGTAGQSDARGTDLSDHKDTSFGVGAGWQFHKNLAAEVGYTNLGKFSGSGVSASADSFQTSLVASYEVAPKVSVLGRLGVARTNLDVDLVLNTKLPLCMYTQYQVTPQVIKNFESTQYTNWL